MALAPLQMAQPRSVRGAAVLSELACVQPLRHLGAELELAQRHVEARSVLALAVGVVVDQHAAHDGVVATTVLCAFAVGVEHALQLAIALAADTQNGRPWAAATSSGLCQ